MCGINGLIGFSDSKELIHSMNETIRHRGPDAEGEYIDKNIALGHRRLSIIDLSTQANQPFIKDGLVIVYNGEIYNFPELRKGLEQRGIVFRTHSDTEVILELFRVYREKSFNKLLGMFSFCIYDMKSKEMFLVRDYFGIKPLYYSFVGDNRFVFSSELKALMALPGIRKDIDKKSLVSCINYLWVYGDGSIFENIKKVPPAHYIRIRTGKADLDVEIKRYWQLQPEVLDLPEDKLLERLKFLLEKSIRRHLIADVPVGSFLSGGLDSSLIAAIAKRSNKSLSTYTISIDSKDTKVERMGNDNYYAEGISKMLDLDHTDIQVKPNIVEDLSSIAYTLDEPIGDPAAINTYLICKVAKEHGIKVLLSGMGADEIFAGYRRQYATLLAKDLSKMPLFVKNGIRGALKYLPVKVGGHGMRQIRWGKRLFSFIDMPIDSAYMRSYSYYDKNELCELFENSSNSEIEEMHRDHNEIYNRMDSLDDINKMCYTDINMFMEGLNLAYTDRASMAASVEVRVPFIDKEMIEFAMSLKGQYKIRNKVSKYLLKKAAETYIPKEIAYRPKASFGMPIRSWISNDLTEMVDDILSVSAVKRRGIFSHRYIKRLLMMTERV